MNHTPTSHAAQAGIDLDSLTRYDYVPGESGRMIIGQYDNGAYLLRSDVESTLARNAACTAPAADERTYTRAEVQRWRDDVAHAAAEIVRRASPSFGSGDWSWLVDSITALAASPAPETAQADDLLNAEELAALRRFDECAQDGEGYDVPREMMQRLAEIGVVRRKSGAYYEATNFGMRVLDRAPSAAPGKADAANAGGLDAALKACVQLETECGPVKRDEFAIHFRRKGIQQCIAAIRSVIDQSATGAADAKDTDLLSALRGASHALRSYQFGNSSPDLAAATADSIDAAIAASQKAGA